MLYRIYVFLHGLSKIILLLNEEKYVFNNHFHFPELTSMKQFIVSIFIVLKERGYSENWET